MKPQTISIIRTCSTDISVCVCMRTAENKTCIVIFYRQDNIQRKLYI